MRLKLARKPGIFVTATDTEVGKTMIAGGIAHLLARAGYAVGPMKPLATGCIRSRGSLESQDGSFLAHCSETDLSQTVICPQTYVTPAAPMVSAQVEGRAIDWQMIAEAWQSLCRGCDVAVVEGIGGVRVPLEVDYDVTAMAADFALPVVVVARASLGTINHTLLTVDALRAKGIEPAGIVINGYNEPLADVAMATNPEVIERLSGVPILAVVGYDETASVEGLRLGQQVVCGLSACDWVKIAGLEMSDGAGAVVEDDEHV